MLQVLRTGLHSSIDSTVFLYRFTDSVYSDIHFAIFGKIRKLADSNIDALMTIDKVSYWKDLAKYDLETAEAMYTTKRWLYVGFMCHQALEKTLKAYWCQTQQNDPPYVHNLVRLVKGCALNQLMTEEQQLFIDQMTPLNIEARYPEYKEALLAALTEEKCREIIDNTQELIQWIETLQ